MSEFYLNSGAGERMDKKVNFLNTEIDPTVKRHFFMEKASGIG